MILKKESSNQIYAYRKYHNIVIVNTISKINQFDMILMLFTVVDNNFRNLIIATAILKNKTELTFTILGFYKN